MRISDWSSDVCSSDLYGNPCRPSAHSPTPRRTPALPERYVGAQALFSGFTNSKDAVSRIPAIRQPRGISSDIPQMPPNPAHKRGPMVAAGAPSGKHGSDITRRTETSAADPPEAGLFGPDLTQDRKTDVSGQSVSVRVLLGGGRRSTKKKI